MAQVMVIGAIDTHVSSVSGILQLAGHVVVEGPSGSAGLQSSTHESIDVVITELPHILAIDLLRSPHRPRETRVIVITTSGALRDAVLAMRLGAFDVLERPVTAAELLDAVRR